MPNRKRVASVAAIAPALAVDSAERSASRASHGADADAGVPVPRESIIRLRSSGADGTVGSSHAGGREVIDFDGMLSDVAGRLATLSYSADALRRIDVGDYIVNDTNSVLESVTTIHEDLVHLRDRVRNLGRRGTVLLETDGPIGSAVADIYQMLMNVLDDREEIMRACADAESLDDVEAFHDLLLTEVESFVLPALRQARWACGAAEPQDGGFGGLSTVLDRLMTNIVSLTESC
jgi:hypothetical protein